jgi:hypothetical protein
MAEGKRSNNGLKQRSSYTHKKTPLRLRRDKIQDNPDQKLLALEESLKNQGFRYKIFSSMREVVHAITNQSVIEVTTSQGVVEKINIAEELKDPNFRFLAKNAPNSSKLLSDAFSAHTEFIRSSFVGDMANKSVQKRVENADEFAVRMFNLIEQLKREEGISTYRDTVKVLNDKKVPTYRSGNMKENGKDMITQKGEWHLSTLQNLHKRWKELGLIPQPKL